MSTNKQALAKTSRLSDAVAGEPAEPSTRAQTTPKSQTTNKPKTTADKLAANIKSTAQAQARADAQAIKNYAEQVYVAELESELKALLGGSERDYFRAEISGWAVPVAANSQQFAAIETAALPSAN